MDKTQAKKSKHFCLMPWMHLHLWPNGNTYPCCIWDSSKVQGTYGPGTRLQDLWNSEGMKELRQQMLRDAPSEGCKRCYDLEAVNIHTLRQSSLEHFDSAWPLVSTTKEDGS